MDTNRTEGYYWVKLEDKWFPCLWSSFYQLGSGEKDIHYAWMFLSTLEQKEVQDDYFQEIDERRILSPTEEIQYITWTNPTLGVGIIPVNGNKMPDND